MVSSDAAAMPTVDVIAGQRHGVPTLGQLDLKDEAVEVTERDLADRQVVLPHATEALVVEGFGLPAIGKKSALLMAKRLGVGQTQDF